MKITKSKLKEIVREEIQKLNESKKIKGKDAGNYVKMAPKGRKITIKDKTYTSLGKGNWKGPRGEKLNWIEISSKASALGNKNVQYEELTKSKLKEMIKEVMAETDGYTNLIQTNKEVEHN